MQDLVYIEKKVEAKQSLRVTFFFSFLVLIFFLTGIQSLSQSIKSEISIKFLYRNY